MPETLTTSADEASVHGDGIQKDGAQWGKSRQIVRRIEVTGTLRLTSPAHFGNGEAGDEVDMPLMRDPLTGTGLLTGASLAGALRNYLWEREMGYGVMPDAKRPSHRRALATQLFGGLRQDDDGVQSSLIVDDAICGESLSELRDGVKIDPTTRTAEDQAKFDLEVLPAGVIFPLHFELLIGAEDDAAELRRALALALQGLESGEEITLGARKKRGFGGCQVVAWRVREWDMDSAAGLLGWLNRDGPWQAAPAPSGAKTIVDLLYAGAAEKDRPNLRDRRQRFDLRATFTIAPDSSLLVRGITGALANGPDAMHIHRRDLSAAGNGSELKPIIPGTSWAGVIRGQAYRIAKTLHGDAGAQWVKRIFGDVIKGSARQDASKQDLYTGSRAEVGESVITGSGVEQNMVVNRIAIDRFTGGVLDNLLFDEMPLFGGVGTRLELRLRLRNPSPAEVGLLLQVLKDLWTGDLPLGSGAAIGRGRLRGLGALLTTALLHEGKIVRGRWRLSSTGSVDPAGVVAGVRLGEGNIDELEAFAAALLAGPNGVGEAG